MFLCNQLKYLTITHVYMKYDPQQNIAGAFVNFDFVRDSFW